MIFARTERLCGKPRVYKLAGFWFVSWTVRGYFANCTGTEGRSYVARDGWAQAIEIALRVVANR